MASGVRLTSRLLSVAGPGLLAPVSAVDVEPPAGLGLGATKLADCGLSLERVELTLRVSPNPIGEPSDNVRPPPKISGLLAGRSSSESADWKRGPGPGRALSGLASDTDEDVVRKGAGSGAAPAVAGGAATPGPLATDCSSARAARAVTDTYENSGEVPGVQPNRSMKSRWAGNSGRSQRAIVVASRGRSSSVVSTKPGAAQRLASSLRNVMTFRRATNLVIGDRSTLTARSDEIEACKSHVGSMLPIAC